MNAWMTGWLYRFDNIGYFYSLAGQSRLVLLKVTVVLRFVRNLHVSLSMQNVKGNSVVHMTSRLL